ncbi:MAG: SCP2 sterol-binding domain-containing protein [Gaiellaceae bacterium]
MAQSAREFFETLESRVDAEKAAGINSSYLFDVDGAGMWKVEVTDVGVNVTEGGTDADCMIAISDDNFERLVAGELNPTTAYMTGKLKVKGDMGAAMKLQKLF